jgi:hypothetical protein
LNVLIQSGSSNAKGEYEIDSSISTLPHFLHGSKLMQSSGESAMQNQGFSALLGAAVLLAGMLGAAYPAAAQGNAGAATMPKVGDMAPNFTLHYFDGNDLMPVSLSQYRGKKNVVLAFFIFAFTGG